MKLKVLIAAALLLPIGAGADEDFNAYTAQLEQLAGTVGPPEVTALRVAQLDLIRDRHALGIRYLESRSPDLRAMGAQMIIEAHDALRVWLERLESRMEQLYDAARSQC